MTEVREVPGRHGAEGTGDGDGGVTVRVSGERERRTGEGARVILI